MNLHPDQLRHQAITHIQNRRFSDAHGIFETLAPLSDHTWDYLWRAITAFANHNFAGALADFQTVLSRDPSDHSALYHCALILAAAPQDALRDGPRALELARNALATTDCDNWMFLTVLAAALAECGEFSRAEEIARRALTWAPEKFHERISARVDQYRRREPFRIAHNDLSDQLELDSKICVKCGAPAFFSCLDSNGRRECLCVSCAQYDFADRNNSAD